MTGSDPDGPRDPLTCDRARVLISARSDGETSGDEDQFVDRHIASCSRCGEYAGRVASLDRSLRIRPAEPVPDLVASVTERARPARLGRGGWLRPALAWVAAVLLVQSLPALVLGEMAGSETHQARHLGAFGAALAIGFAFAAWKPHRAFGLLPFTVALVVTTLASVIADIASGTRTPIAELVHASEVIGLVLLWMISGSPGWQGSGRDRRRRQEHRGSRGHGLAGLDPLQ